MMLALKVLLAATMTGAGVMHFVMPRAYLRIMPRFFPAPLLLVQVSGAFEVLGGVGLLWPPTQQLAAWGLVLLFIAVFPANVNQALQGLPFGKAPVWVTWARLPLQAVFIAWAWAFT